MGHVGLKSECSIVFPLSGTLFSLCGYRVDTSSRENTCAVLAPGNPPNNSPININDSHRAAGHSHEVPLRKYQGAARDRPRGGACRSARGAPW